MKTNSYFVKVVAALTLVTFIAAGCGDSAPKKKRITLRVWKTFEDSGNMQPLIQAFRKKYSYVSIEYTKKNIEHYEEDLINALATGTGPDVFSIQNAWLPKYLDKVLPTDESQWKFNDYKNAFVDVVVDDFTINRKIYGTALAVDSLALYYNKDILGSAGIATPPKTWRDLTSAVQKITRQDKTGYFTRSGATLGLSSIAPGGQINRAEDIVYLMMLQKGVEPYNDDRSSPTFTNATEKNGEYVNGASEALKFYTSFASPSNPNYTWNTRSDYSIDAFANGRAAMMYGYSYTADLIREKAPNLNFDVAPVPQPNLQDTEVNFANYWGEVVSRQTQYPKEAWEFLKIISSKDALDQYYAQHKQPSSRKDLIELQTDDPDIGVFAHANLTAKAFFRPDQVKMDTIFGRMIDRITLKGSTIEEALGQASSQASTITVPRAE